MSRASSSACPSWGSVVEARRLGDEPEGWASVRRHLRDCAGCRQQALALDPTLLFQLLPEPATAVDEIAKMRQRIAHARRDRAAAANLARRPRPTWLGAAAAASLALLLAPVPERVREQPVDAATALPAAVSAALEQLPLVESEEGDLTPVYEWSGAELSIVLLADERRDVG